MLNTAKKDVPAVISYLYITLVGCALLTLIFQNVNSLTYAQMLTHASLDTTTHLWETERRQTIRVHIPILMYHYVEIVRDERDTIRQSLAISPTTFESQLITLKTSGYTPVTLSSVADYFENKGQLPNKPVIITFDDGYRDFYTDVLPLLKKHSVPAVLFMVSGFLDSTHNYLTSQQLIEISSTDLVEIGSHSVTHPDFHFIDPGIQQAEIVASKNQLETLLEKSVDHFAYPFGHETTEAYRSVKSAGFRTAAGTEKGVFQSYDERFTLKRIRPGTYTGTALIDLLEGTTSLFY